MLRELVRVFTGEREEVRRRVERVKRQVAASDVDVEEVAVDLGTVPGDGDEVARDLSRLRGLRYR